MWESPADRGRSPTNLGWHTTLLHSVFDLSGVVREAGQGRSASSSPHPKLVETGLDLLDFSHHHFLGVGIFLHTLRQAESPILADRTKQTSPGENFATKGRCRHRVCAYGEEAPCGAHDGGRVCRRGIADRSTKTMTCCRRWRANWSKGTELANRADSVWKALNQEHQKLFPASSRYQTKSSPSDRSADCRLHAFRLRQRALSKERWLGRSVIFGQRPESPCRKKASRETSKRPGTSIPGFS